MFIYTNYNVRAFYVSVYYLTSYYVFNVLDWQIQFNFIMQIAFCISIVYIL